LNVRLKVTYRSPPLRRGLGQLRGPAFMPGLLQGTEGFGGTGLSQDLVREGIIDYGGRVVPEGTPDAEEINRGVIRDYILNEMIPQGLSPAEVAAASPTLSLGATQQYYNQFAPQGVFSTAAPGRTVLPEDFVLQTGAYGAPTPTFLALPEKNTAASAAETPLPSRSIQGTDYTQNPIIGYTDVGTPIYSPNSADNSSEARAGGIIKMAEGGEAQESGGYATSNINTYIDRLIASGGTGEDIKGAMNLYGVTPEQVGEAYPQFSLEELTGNYENLQASPAERIRAFEKRYSTEEAVRQAGSKFDVADYLDEQGRLVGGYSKPMYDKFNRFIGYEYKPYESNVVFGEELRRKEAAMRPTDGEIVDPLEHNARLVREQMMIEMAMRQGRTGISPITGGLAGIEIGDPMMRRRPQYYSTVEESRPRYAEGGLASVAQNLADKGRKGDSMLVHMTPDEVAGLQALAQQMGGSLTINPQTGLPEANIFKKLLPMALGFALGPAGFGVFQSALTAGLAVGAGYTLATGSLQQGISAGLGAYGGSNLGTGLQAAGADAATSAAASEAAGTGLQVAGGAGGAAAEAAMVNPMATSEGLRLGATEGFQAALPEVSNVSLTATGPTAGSVATGLGGGVAPAVPTTTTLPIETVQIGGPQAGMRTTELATVPQSTSGSALTGAERYLGDKATSDLAAADYADATGSTLGTSLTQIAGGAAGQSAADAERAVKAQQAAIVAKQDERKRRFDALFGRTVGTLPARSGGLMKLAGGGMTYMEAGGTTGPTGTPRDVTGTGDGMSDSVPASIEGVQEARLADGEFVIPADVVADIGNGSSDAGSKKLYDMMDRIRKARHGTTEQPPEIQAERLMPA
jgi:hypothetical protein